MKNPRVTAVGAGAMMMADQRVGQTCLLVQWPESDGTIGHLLFDAGGGLDIVGRLGKAKQLVDRVAISHLHSDHVNGLSALVILNFFRLGRRLKLYLPASMKLALWGMLEPTLGTLDDRRATFETYFEWIDVKPGRWYGLSPNLKMLMFPTQHFHNGTEVWQPSYGLQLEAVVDDGGGGQRIVRFLYTGDTRFTPGVLMRRYEWADVILHDGETLPEPTSVHSHVRDILTLPASVLAKMWLIHYNDNFASWNAKLAEVGLLGFVQPGQEFRFGQRSTFLMPHDPLGGSGHESGYPED